MDEASGGAERARSQNIRERVLLYQLGNAWFIFV